LRLGGGLPVQFRLGTLVLAALWFGLASVGTKNSFYLARTGEDDMTAQKCARSEILRMSVFAYLPVLSALLCPAAFSLSPVNAQTADVSANRLDGHPRITIAGVCRDEQGEPVVDAEVRIYAIHANLEQQELLRTTRSDGNGNFDLGEFPKPGLPGVHYGALGQSGIAIAPTAFHVYLSKKGMATQSFSLPCNNPGQLEAIFKPAAELKGQVVGPDNAPVAGAKVYLAGFVKDEIGSATTSADGRFVIADIPSYQAEMIPSKGRMVPASGAGLVVEHPAFGFKQSWYTQCPGTVDIHLDEPAIVEGAVSRPDGQPASDVRVWATSTPDELSQGRWSRSTAVTDKLGRYHVVLQGVNSVRIKVFDGQFDDVVVESFSVEPGKTKQARPVRLPTRRRVK
jgi:hypothetical protein